MPKNWLTYCAICLLSLGCAEPDPGPEGFLDYSLPAYNGMHEPTLRELDEKISMAGLGDMHGLIIIRNGSIVFEKYYAGYNADDLHTLSAATQSVVSTVIGIGLRQGIVRDLNLRVIDFLPEYKSYFQDVPLKDQITLRHLLSHTSGLWWDEWRTPYENPENDAYQMSLSDDWLQYIIAKPMIQEPGATFNFNSGNPILAKEMMDSLSGMSFEDYTAANLFSRIGIDTWAWERSPDDDVNTAWGLSLRPMDFARIGYLYLNNGAWESDSLFQDIWSRRVSIPRISVSSYYNYGLMWWTLTNQADVVRRLSTNDIFFAWGNSGQHMFVVPHLKLVVVMSAGTLTNEFTPVEIMRDYIFPSIIDD